MNVYKIVPNGNYVYGVAIVAAYDEEQAINTFINAGEYQEFEYDEYNCDCVLIHNLEYKGDNSKLILDSIGEG